MCGVLLCVRWRHHHTVTCFWFTWLFLTLMPCKSFMFICCCHSSLLSLFYVFLFSVTPIHVARSLPGSWKGWLFICVNPLEGQHTERTVEEPNMYVCTIKNHSFLLVLNSLLLAIMTVMIAITSCFCSHPSSIDHFDRYKSTGLASFKHPDKSPNEEINTSTCIKAFHLQKSDSL